ncbi:DUF2911 domain-containing protein [Pseudocnuella soli]|uniref:DUF2911 domain-containing protein n=1 Tax=Pseudocnuella soli TaxID=2502779 RepID=UPI001048B280|nr:DUF2911 domain-containing protein [Pseudocnuella soli]
MKLLFATALVLLLAGCAGNDAEEPRVTPTPRRDSPLLAAVPANPLLALDRSRMDMAYFPVDYPILKTSGKIQGPPMARVIYSRPQRQGRTIFGELVPYGQPWRLGANEATEIELFAPATIGGQNVSKGRYIMYCIPEASQWTIVFNTNLYTWGLKPNPLDDAYRFTIPIQPTEHSLEHFTMVFNQSKDGAELVIGWEQTEGRLPIQFK